MILPPELRPCPGALEPPDFAGSVDFRALLSDFRVDEVARFTPQDGGPHRYLQIQKSGVSTPALIAQLRAIYGAPEREVGVAGQKDQRGITTQWVSLPASRVFDDGEALEQAGPFVVRGSCFHPKKLRLGQLIENHFTVVLRHPAGVGPAIEARAQRVAADGLLNRFGAQRFGRGSDWLERAGRFVAQNKRARSRRERFYVSQLQSVWFHHWLAERSADGLLDVAVPGDVLSKRDRPVLFDCEDAAVDTRRIAAGEVTPTGPLWGRRMRRASAHAMTRESRSLLPFGIDREWIAAHPAFSSGARRAVRADVRSLDVEVGERATILGFALPKGSYATVFLQEICGDRLVDHALVPASPMS